MLKRGSNIAGNMVDSLRRRVDLGGGSNHDYVDDDDGYDEREDQKIVKSLSSPSSAGNKDNTDDGFVQVDLATGKEMASSSPLDHIRRVPSKSPDQKIRQSLSSGDGRGSIVSASASTDYTLGDHAEFLDLHKEVGICDDGYYFDDVGPFLMESNMSQLIKEYCSPIPFHKLNTIYFGLDEKTETNHKQLPVRTLIFRLRPDIMVGVVIDAIQEACEGHTDFSAHMLSKFPEGHLRCLIIPKDETDSSVIPYCICDAVVATRRIGNMERELVLRLYHPSSDMVPQELWDKYYMTAEQMQKQQDEIKLMASNESATSNGEGGIMIPMNLKLKESCCFLQYLSQKDNKADSRSPENSPKSSTAYFNSNFDPTFSVKLVKDLGVINRPIYPALNSEDWYLLQSSWQLISRIWQNLMLDNCPFHTIVDIPVIDPTDESQDGGDGSGGGPILDLHYCAQIRQMARDCMLGEVMGSYNDLQRTLDEKEKIFSNFIQMMRRPWKRYQMKELKETFSKPPMLKTPTNICPAGFTIIAAMACKVAHDDPNNPAAICDDAVQKVYKTFCSQDDLTARKNLKESNKIVMDRLVHIQKLQMNLVKDVETCPSAQKAAKQFVKLAREATNSNGRVDRLVLACVPLLDIQVLNGLCQITSTAIMCRSSGIFGTAKTFIFDLKAVKFETKGHNCLAITSSIIPTEVYYKLHTSTNVYNLKLFLETLQTLQSVFEINPEEAVSGMVEEQTTA